MKAILSILLFVPLFLCAQIPGAISYQGVATDANGTELTNQNISLQISILKATANGPNEFVEVHSTTTDDYGLFNINIGTGTYITGPSARLVDIDWAGSWYFLKVEMDATGGSNYAFMGSNQILTVPYAYYADKAGSIDGRKGSDSKTLIYLGGM